MNVRNYKSVKERREALERETGAKLPHIGTFNLDEKIASSRHCENMIGAVQVPVGVAGPLRIRTQNSELNDQQGKEYYIPLATTEGALVASVSRGCKAIHESGGAFVDEHYVGATRGPVFRVLGMAERQRLNIWLNEHFAELQEIAASTSHHLKLLSFFSRGVGRWRYIRFAFDTQDAMGLNMVTIATDAMTKYIKDKTGIDCLALSGNFCVDKKPSWLNTIEGRGHKTCAEVVLPEQVLRTVLTTSAQKVFDVWLSKCVMGSMMSGSMGTNAHAANVIAALFLATGQDIAHVAESSVVFTTVEVLDGKDLYFSVYIPDLMVGTVGGGTGLATQNEALSILGIAGGDDGKNGQRLAEIVTGAVLAGEISLLSSLGQGTLAQAHKKLGRGE